jgi:hypothetical protein
MQEFLMRTPLRFSHATAVAVLIMTTVLLTSCTAFRPRPEATKTPACRPLPENFQEEDLIGTWVAEYNGGVAIDRLVIKEDGTYKQIFMDTLTPSRNFESDWSKWWLEQRPSGYIRLHMDGMRKCDNLEEICERPSGGMSLSDWAIDPCEGELISMPDKTVLIVSGYHLPRPGEIVLRQTRVGGSEWTYSFTLQE